MDDHTNDTQNDIVTTDLVCLRKERRVISLGYLLLYTSILAAFIPNTTISIAALILTLATLAGLYMFGAQSKEDTLTFSHSHFLIRTFWRFNLFLVVTVLLMGIYMYFFVSFSPLDACMNAIQANALTLVENNDTSAMYGMLFPCLPAFWTENMMHLILSGVIGLTLPMGYLVLRAVRGITALCRYETINS